MVKNYKMKIMCGAGNSFAGSRGTEIGIQALEQYIVIIHLQSVLKLLFPPHPLDSISDFLMPLKNIKLQYTIDCPWRHGHCITLTKQTTRQGVWLKNLKSEGKCRWQTQLHRHLLQSLLRAQQAPLWVSRPPHLHEQGLTLIWYCDCWNLWTSPIPRLSIDYKYVPFHLRLNLCLLFASTEWLS